MRRLLIALLVAVGAVAVGVVAPPASRPARAADLFTEVVVMSTKTGFRTVVAWQATNPVAGIVRWGTSPDALTNVSGADFAVGADRAQLAVVEGLTPGRTYWYQVEDRLTGQRSRTVAVRAGNAYNAWSGRTYTINLLVQLDSPEAPVGARGGDVTLNELAAGINVMAERVYDALDGFARIGKVIITDTTTDGAANVPFGPGALLFEDGQPCTPAGGVADVLVETAPPFDTHTYTGWAIAQPCTALYIGREGQLLASQWRDELHLGYALAHELLHYGFNAPDLYPFNSSADCWNTAWDGSLLHNRGGWDDSSGRWRGTELDRNERLTPCEMGDEPYTWDQLRARYTRVPARPNGPIEHVVDTRPTGNPDGGALEIFVLRRIPGGSRLVRFHAED